MAQLTTIPNSTLFTREVLVASASLVAGCPELQVILVENLRRLRLFCG